MNKLSKLFFGKSEKRNTKLETDDENFKEQDYLILNPDVKMAVEREEFASGYEHWLAFGKSEKRNTKFKIENNELGGGIWSSNLFLYPNSKIDFDPKLYISKKIWKLTKNEFTRLCRSQNIKPNSKKYQDEVGMWSIAMKNFIPISNEIDNQNLTKFNAQICNFFQNNLCHGLGGGYSAFKIAQIYSKSYLELIADKVIRMSELLGISNIRSCEQTGDFTRNFKINFEEDIKKILNELKLKNHRRPNVGGIYGISANSFIWHLRDFEHLAAAVEILNLYGRRKSISIMEIGGGYGNLAYWLYALGFKDITIYDLPNINILQFYYLSKTIGSFNINLYGEKFKKNTIKIYPYWALFESSKKVSCAINQDSFAEIPYNISRAYLLQIKKITNDYFLSINQENMSQSYKTSQINLSKVIKSVKGFKRIRRSQFWLRQGYANEIYKIIRKN